jgi:hypothetical protein
MNLLRTSMLVLCLAGLLALEDDPIGVVASARAAFSAGRPGQVILAAGSDDAARARLARLSGAIQRGLFDLTPCEQRILDDCAAVLVEGSRPRNGRPDRFALYLVREDGAWRLLPDPTRPRAADALRTARLASLEPWIMERIAVEPVALAGDASATWMLGEATVAGSRVRPGSGIAFGQRIVLPQGKPGRMVLNRLDGSSITCAPGTALTLVEEQVGSGTDLVIDLEDGAVQVDVLARGPYAHVRVRGLVSDVTVVGTIFLVQRVAQDREYVAQVAGTVTVRSRAVGTSVELTEHHGVGVSLVGLDPVDLLLSRPQLTPERLAKGDLRSQGLAADPSGGGWSQDHIRDQSPRPVTAGAQAAATQAVDDGAAPPARSDGTSGSSAGTTKPRSTSVSKQVGITATSQAGSTGVTTNPAATAGGSSGGSAGGISPGASPSALGSHPGFPSP